MTKRKELILWIDLETTGLDHEADPILEVGYILTDTDLAKLAEGSHVVRKHASAERRLAANDYVRAMHKASGLLEEQENTFDCMHLGTIEEKLIGLLDEHGDEDTVAYLGGNSVHFDRRFIAYDMPELDARLSHRHFDVRVFELAESFWSDDRKLVSSGESKHRALDDINYSLDVAKAARARRFKPSDL